MIVIGNGESRKHIDFDLIKELKVGCNAICRDWHVDHLICCDRKMVLEALTRIDFNKTKMYTRTDNVHMNKNLLALPSLPKVSKDRRDQPIHWGSGAYAVLLASGINSNSLIKLIGFDLYGNINLLNNVYKDTQNYNSATSHSVDPRYWIYQMALCFHAHPHQNYVLYHKPNFNVPAEWNSANLSFRLLTDFS